MSDLKTKPLFLIGGHDLEMIEIKKLLIKNKQEFIDYNLSWGAKLSSYQNILNKYEYKYRTIIAIELINDISISQNFINIDHHNEYYYLPSSIEQIAKILNINLNFYQKLVAINDVSHIKGLKQFGLSEKKIEDIRKKDREIQGVSEKDEYLALKEIKNRTYIGNICIIKTSLKTTSPIVDRLEEENLIIYSNRDLIYFGKNRNKLVLFFIDLIKEKKAFYGGTEQGYFGFVKNTFSKNKILNFLKEIISKCQ